MLSFMATEFFQRSPMLMLPLVALAIFMLVFFAVTVRTVLTNKSRFDAMANLPLEHDGPTDLQHARDDEEAHRG